MRGLINLLFIVLLALGIFASYDQPINGAQRLMGMDVPVRAGQRQAIFPLRVAIDLDARREGRRVAVLLEGLVLLLP